MAYIPAESGASGVLTTTHDLGEVGNPTTLAVNTNKIVSLTPPGTGCIPIGWSYSQVLQVTGGSIGAVNGVFRFYSNAWSLMLRNFDTADISITATITVAWAKQ